MKGIGTTSLSICASLGLLTVAIACGSGDADPEAGGNAGSGNSGNTGNTSSGGSGNAGNSGGSGNSGNSPGGGTDSGGSGNTGNTGGSGGGNSGTSVCDDNTAPYLPETGYVDNFETDVRLLGWYAFADDGNGEPHEVTREPGGALDTETALHITASGITPPTEGGYGAGFGFNMVDPAISACVNVSDFDGISFWARGTSGTDQVLTFQVVHPATAPVADGGDCTVTTQCYVHPKKAITLAEDPDEWTQYTITWDDLGGSVATVTGPILGFNVITAGTDYDVWIDEVTLYAGTAPTGPVMPDEGGGAGGAGGGGG